MTEQNALAIYQPVVDMILSATDQLEFAAGADTVDWKQISEAIDPQGDMVKAADLVGETFAIRKMKPFESSFPGSRELVYWIVGQTEEGRVFNTVLGGAAVCEELDKILYINAQAKAAYQAGDQETLQHYINVGAGRRPIVTLDRKASGKGKPYYIFTRLDTPQA